MSKEDGKPTIQELQTELLSIKDKCQDVGIHLGLDDDILGRLEQEHSSDKATQFRQILRLWLKRDDASWSRLVAVLQHPVISEGSLAATLKAKYCTGRSQRLNTSLAHQSSTSDDTPTSSSAHVATTGKLVVYPLEFFSREPDLDRRCVECGQVPKDPQRSSCCDLIYCIHCTKPTCNVHNTPVTYTVDKHLATKISDLSSKCIYCGKWKSKTKGLNKHLRECPALTAATPADSSHHPDQSAETAVLSPIPLIEPSTSDSRTKRPLSVDLSDPTASQPTKVPRLGEASTPRPTADPATTATSSEFEEPTHFNDNDFVSPPKAHYKCGICQRVPKKAMKTKCCEVVYCKQCATKPKTCPVHKTEKLHTHSEFTQEISKLMVYCKNQTKGCMWRKPISQLKSHLLNGCTISCPYNSLGCTVTVTNSTFLEHMHSGVLEHLNQVRKGSEVSYEMASVSNNRLAGLEHQVSRLSTPPQLFVIGDTDKLTSENRWISPGFYSHQVGFKLHLEVWFHTDQNAFTLAMICDEGLFDCTLTWPCKGKMRIKVFNQTRKSGSTSSISGGHLTRDLKFSLDRATPFMYICSLGEVKNTLYTLNNVMYLRVASISLDSQLQWLYTD